MKASTFSTTTIFIIVAFGMATFLFLGFSSFGTITHSADIVSENIKQLNAIDCTHIIKACLEGDDDVITVSEVVSFTKKYCDNRFPALSGLEYEFRIEDLDDPSVSKQSSGYVHDGSGHGLSGSYSHSIFINIQSGNDIHIGRLYVQTR